MIRRTIPTLCAIVFVAAQVHLAAQSKATTPARPAAKAAPAKTAAAKAAPAKAAVKAVPAAGPIGSITMTGCLHADGRRYMLTNLEGSQVPTGRNWKTAFVTKKSKDVEVTPSPGVRLGDHLDRKVSVVGTRDGETHLQARSIKQITGSCS